MTRRAAASTCGKGWRSGSWWTALFRFTPLEFFQDVTPALRLPDVFWEDGHVCESELRRADADGQALSPRPLRPDLEMLFRRDESRIPRFINLAMTHIYTTFAYTFA